VFTLTGQKVATLVNGNQTAGAHSIQWHGCDEVNQLLASGAYWYRLSISETTLTKKMLFIR